MHHIVVSSRIWTSVVVVTFFFTYFQNQQIGSVEEGMSNSHNMELFARKNNEIKYFMWQANFIKGTVSYA